MFQNFVKNYFQGVTRTLLFATGLLIAPINFYGPSLSQAVEIQSVQFSQVQPYNDTLKCNSRSNFSSPFHQKIPDLSKVVQYNPETILQLNLTGIWALYYGVNYTSTVVISESTCLMQSTDRSPYKSMRFLGNSDADSPGLSLFPGDGGVAYPHGVETFITQSQFNIPGSEPMCVAFWASTGNSTWTVFSQRNFVGASSCLQGSSYQKNARGSLDYVLVGSVRMGCSTNRTSNLNNNENSDNSNSMRLTSCRNSWTTPSPTTTTKGTASANCRANIFTMFVMFLSLILLHQK